MFNTACILPTQKAFVLISGASRGIGQAIALDMARYFATNSHVVLLARDAVALQSTANVIRQQNGDRVGVTVVPIDLSTPNDTELDAIFDCVPTTSGFDVALVVHNVGTIGDITLDADQCGSAALWQSFFATNVFAVIALNVAFLKRFAGANAQLNVINITSKAGRHPFPSFTLYCSSRAAREMYFRVLAVERTDVHVLNYSPGVVETDMTVTVQEKSASYALRNEFRELRESGKMLCPSETSAILMRVLANASYKSGDKVDYYDALAECGESKCNNGN